VIVKVCGITNAEDLRAAVDAGATALGFIFHPPSPRYVPPAKYLELSALVPVGVKKVGVFTSAPLDLDGLDVAQIYGAFSARIPIWRAYRIANDIPDLDGNAEAILLDGIANGNTFAWSQARSLKPRIIVAGGLTPENVAEAIAAALPWGVDACSGLESAPGRKDHVKVKAFVKNARAAFEQRAEIHPRT